MFDLMDENFVNNAKDYSLDPDSVYEREVADYISKEYEANIEADGVTGKLRFACVFDADNDQIIMITHMSADHSDIDYVSDYETMLRTAEKAGGNTDDDDKGSKEEKSGSAQDKPSDASAGVNPELKAFLDDYEAFCDEYAAFMKKYLNNPTDVLGMLGDYTRMVQNLEEYSKRLDEYDPDVMSPEDAAYYLEVVTRCQQKMLAFAE